METNFIKEQAFLDAKKRVKEIKAFYIHLTVYIVVNLFLSGIILFGLTHSGWSLGGAFSNFGVYATWVFWGIGIFFHGIVVFNVFNFVGKDWEQRKIKEFMEKDKNQYKNRK